MTALIVERLFKGCLSSTGLLEITKGLNHDGLKTRKNYEWSETTVHKILKNEAYTRVLLWGQESSNGNSGNRLPHTRVEGAWPPIIDRETYEKVQTKLGSRAPKITHPRVAHSEYIILLHVW